MLNAETDDDAATATDPPQSPRSRRRFRHAATAPPPPPPPPPTLPPRRHHPPHHNPPRPTKSGYARFSPPLRAFVLCVDRATGRGRKEDLLTVLRGSPRSDASTSPRDPA